MKNGIVMAGAAALALSGGFAKAEGHEGDECFDKGSLEYFDCPAEPEPMMEEEPMMVDDEGGYYAGFRGGVAFLEDTEFEWNGLDIENEYDTGYVISAMAGYQFVDAISPGLSFRPEIEIGYLAADVDIHNVFVQSTRNPGLSDGSTGDTSVLFGFVNAFVDYEVTPGFDIFAGGGVGIGQTSFDGHGVSATGVIMDDDDIGFGYNIGAGVAFEVAEDVIIEGMYRYMSFDAELEAVDGTESDVDVDAHTATIGIRFEF